MHAGLLHLLHHRSDLRGRQLRELAVVNGDVRLAARRIGGAAGAGDVPLDLHQHGLHAGEVGGTCGGVLQVCF